MRIATATLKSAAAYSQSRPHDAPHLTDPQGREVESADDYDRRTWREHLHTDADGHVIIPGTVFRNALTDAAAYLGLKIKGGGNKTWTKHFKGGVLVAKPLRLDLKKEDAVSERLFLNADGKRGGGKRVWRTYPVIHEWGGAVEYVILDEKITPEVFEEHERACGQYVGIGRFRPINNGYYGRFEVVKVKWK